MKATDRMILSVLVGVGLLAGFYLLVVSPKRSEVAELSDRADVLRASVSALQSEASAGEAAREEFPEHYERMVVLGKAIPADDEEADLIVGLNRIGGRADVEFRSIALGTGTELAVPEIQRPNPATGEDPGTPPEGADEETPVAVGAVPTEASASALPIGASIGPAGLGVMPWDITFDGDFFDLSRVMAQIDFMVRFDGKASSKVRGRLVTVDGFSLTRIDDEQVPRLQAGLAIRSYITPKGETVTLGATPAGPAAVPVSSEVAP